MLNEIALNPKYDRYQGKVAINVYKFFDKKIKSSAIAYVNKVVAQ